MQPFISHQSIISVLLLNNARLCQALVQMIVDDTALVSKQRISIMRPKGLICVDDVN